MYLSPGEKCLINGVSVNTYRLCNASCCCMLLAVDLVTLYTQAKGAFSCHRARPAAGPFHLGECYSSFVGGGGGTYEKGRGLVDFLFCFGGFKL